MTSAKLMGTPLFMGMNRAEIEESLRESEAELVSYEKDGMIFTQRDRPQRLFVLLEGTVVVGNDSSAGRRSIVATFHQAGEMFGEVFLFLDKGEYDHYAQAVTAAKVLQLPKTAFFGTEGHLSSHSRLAANMMSILAQKAYYLNRKLQIVSCSTLRQKIAKVLLQNCQPDGRVTLSMNREELADFLSTARPSLSRELMKMQDEGLILIQKKEIFLPSPDLLRELA